MGFQWMCFPNSQIESYIRFFVLLLKEMQHNSLKSMKKSMKIKEKISIFDINLRLYILHNIQWFKYEPTSGHWFLVRRFYKVRTMIMTLKIVPKKFGSMVFPWHGHDVCYSLHFRPSKWNVLFLKNLFHFRYQNLIQWLFCSVLCFRYNNRKLNVCHCPIIFNSDNII